MKQMNEMSARALNMEELEMVNGGIGKDEINLPDPIGYLIKKFIGPIVPNM